MKNKLDNIDTGNLNEIKESNKFLRQKQKI